MIGATPGIIVAAGTEPEDEGETEEVLNPLQIPLA